MGSMSASDAAPLPRLGEVFFDVRGSSRSMRLSWYSDTGVAVFSIWQGGTCTGTFRLPIDDLPRMVEALQRGPRGAALPAGESRDQERGQERGLGAERQRRGLTSAPTEAMPAVAEYATGQIVPVTGEFRSLGPAEPSYRDDPLAYRDDPLGSGGYPGYRDRGRDNNRGGDQDSPGGSFPGYADDGPPVYRDRTPPPAYRDDPLGTPRYRDAPPATSSYRDGPPGSGGYRDHSLPGGSPGHRDSDPYGGDPLGSGSYPSYRDRAGDDNRGGDQDSPGGSFPGYADDGPPVYRDSPPPPAYGDDPLGSGGYRDGSLPGSVPGSRPGHRDSDPYGGDPLGSGSSPQLPGGPVPARLPGRAGLVSRGGTRATVCRMTRSSRCIRTTPAGPPTPTTCGPVRTRTPCRRTARNRERPAAVPDPSPEPREIGKKSRGREQWGRALRS